MKVWLDKVPMRQERHERLGNPIESESQERMLVIVKKGHGSPS
jgi:phosphoribosylformylglycinamidine (FGAM) synthase-like enzyme